MFTFRVAAMLVAAVSTVAISSARGKDSSSAAVPAGARDPGDPQAVVPGVTYRSAFERYRSNAEVEVGAWGPINADVGRIGGWRTYGKEAVPGAPSTPLGAPRPVGPSAPSGDSTDHVHKR